MHLTSELLAFLQTPKALAELSSLTAQSIRDQDILPRLTRLRQEFSPVEAGALLETAQLRQRAVTKFGEDAQRMFFIREALEQASDAKIRSWRVREAVSMGVKSIVDVCSSIGSDALAFAQAGLDVLGIDKDTERVEIANLNASMLGLASQARFVTADATEDWSQLLSTPTDMIFFDPARRVNDRRVYDVEKYQPPYSTIQKWTHGSQFLQPNGVILSKVSPGVELDQLRPYGGRVDFISVEGDLKEADHWVMPHAEPFRTRAILIQASEVLTWESHEDLEAVVDAPRQWVCEPDPALIRAGLVRDVARHWNGAQMDDMIAYITTDVKPRSNWVRSWPILDWMPFHVKRLRAYLREHDIGEVVIKKRGTAVTPESLLPQLKLKGNRSVTLFLTRYKDKQIFIICGMEEK